MRTLTLAALLLASAPVAAQVKSPDRPVSDPRSLSSAENAAAASVPVEDIGTTRSLGSAAWSADGKAIFIATNLTGRTNIWRTDAAGSWPIQLTQSDDTQRGLVTSRDGKWVYFEQDKGGNEYTDIYRVPATGGAVANLTNTPDRQERDLLVAPQGGMIALVTKLKSEGQSNLAVMDADGKLRALTAEKDPQFGWTPVAWIDGGRALIANRDRVDGVVGEVWRIDVADGKATRLLGKPDTIFLQATRPLMVRPSPSPATTGPASSMPGFTPSPPKAGAGSSQRRGNR